MARKEVEKGKNIVVFLGQDTIDRLDRLAASADIPRGKMLREVIDAWSEMMEACNKMGVYAFPLLMRHFKDALVENYNALHDEMDRYLHRAHEIENMWEERPWKHEGMN